MTDSTEREALLRSALERLLWQFRLSLAGRPVICADEAIAEAEHALATQAPQPQQAPQAQCFRGGTCAEGCASPEKCSRSQLWLQVAEAKLEMFTLCPQHRANMREAVASLRPLKETAK